MENSKLTPLRTIDRAPVVIAGARPGRPIVISIVESLFPKLLPDSRIVNGVEIVAKSSSRFNNLGF